jgi:energy-coupling factor transporter ATP-binding protein EcfA2
MKYLITLEAALKNVGQLKAAQQVKDLSSPVLMHIAGPSGSGKTTVLNKIKQLYPQVVIKDLDEIDEEASANLGFSSVRKSEWSDEDFEAHQEERQKVLDSFIDTHSGSPIILGGFHSEGGGSYAVTINAQKFVRLNTDAKTSVMRAFERSQKEDIKYKKNFDEIPLDIAYAESDIASLEESGYRPMAKEEILEFIGNAVKKLGV